jgi:hypothetical protein
MDRSVVSPSEPHHAIFGCAGMFEKAAGMPLFQRHISLLLVNTGKCACFFAFHPAI